MINIDDVRRKTYGYFYQDGLVEIVIGTLLVGIPLALLLLQSASESSTLLMWTAGIALVILIIGVILASRYVINAIKERAIYPRTGYVAYRDQASRGRWVVIGVALLFSVGGLVLKLLNVDLPQWTQAMALIEGVLLCVVLLIVGERGGVRRFYAIAALALITGVVAAVGGLDDIPGSIVTFGVTGLALITSGGLAFVRYLGANPPPSEV